ncbi:MAG: DUF3788 family protein [Bacteroidales bacterium]|nr:DUF3788 family protein [Bacteroidales bacterium]
MEDISIFTDKAIKPTNKDIIENLDSTYELWNKIHEFVLEKYPNGLAEWNYPGKKYGWSYRIKDKKRAIIYFLPRDKYFKVAFVFGQKATDIVLESNISPDIKTELAQATKYAEGRGIRIDIKNDSILPDIKQLIEIKLKN